MSKFIVQMVNAYTREVLDTEDDIFDNEQDAEAYARECGGAFAEGGDLSFAGESERGRGLQVLVQTARRV